MKIGIIVDGQYYPDAQSAPQPQRQSVTYKGWSHDMQRADHRRDLIQPYDRSGKPSQEFIAQYPQEAKDNYGFIK